MGPDAATPRKRTREDVEVKGGNTDFEAGRGTTRADDAQGTPTQSLILVYEEKETGEDSARGRVAVAHHVPQHLVHVAALQRERERARKRHRV